MTWTANAPGTVGFAIWTIVISRMARVTFSRTNFLFGKKELILLPPSRLRLSLPVALGVIVSVWILIIITTTIQPAVPVYGHAIPSTFSIEPNSILEKDSLPSQLV